MPHDPALPRVLCLHSSASTPRQWRRLADALAPRAAVVAPPLAGYADDTPWQRRAAGWRLDDEVERLRPTLDDGAPWHVVGHSFGGAVALQLALRHPERVASLTLFEPVRFAWLAAAPVAWPQVTEIAAVAGAVGDAVAAGDPMRAAAGFIDYWSGDGAFAALPPERRAAAALRMPKVADEFAAAFADATPLAALRELRLPVLLLGGAHSPAPVRELLRRIAGARPQAQVPPPLPAGHMAPVTHADAVNAAIGRFLDAQRATLDEALAA